MAERVLDGRAAVVTGGSRGIGRAIVERLARDGATVVFGYHRNADAAGEVEKAVAAEGGAAHGVPVDLGAREPRTSSRRAPPTPTCCAPPTPRRAWRG